MYNILENSTEQQQSPLYLLFPLCTKKSRTTTVSNSSHDRHRRSDYKRNENK